MMIDGVFFGNVKVSLLFPRIPTKGKTNYSLMNSSLSPRGDPVRRDFCKYSSCNDLNSLFVMGQLWVGDAG